MARKIGNKVEKKIAISVVDVEIVVNDLLEEYNIDQKVELYVNNKLDNILNEMEIRSNNRLKTGRNYKYQFGKELFDDIHDYTYNLLENCIKNNLEDMKISLGDKFEEDEDYQKKKLVYDNIFQIVELTMYQEGISKIKLIAYHYLVKCLEQHAIRIIENDDITKIRGYKTPIEVFNYELMEIIANSHEMEKFTLTLRSLIEQWLLKYNNRTKIGQFYYDVLMVNPEQIIEKILRYLLFTALKNVNPITLRAIFSTYITLIHKNIFSFYAMKLQNIKVGYFKQLESLFEDNIINNTTRVNTHQMIAQNRLLNHAMKNKRFLKHNYEFMLDEFSASFFDINYFDLLYSYNKDINILDYHFYYSKILKLTNNSFRSQSKLYKIHQKYYRKNSKKTLSLYINDIVEDRFYEHFLNQFQEEETAHTICNNITQNLLNNINQNNLTTPEFKKIVMSIDDYVSQLSQIIGSLNKLIK